MIEQRVWEEVIGDNLELRVKYVERNVKVIFPKSRALAVVGPRRAGKHTSSFSCGMRLTARGRKVFT